MATPAIGKETRKRISLIPSIMDELGALRLKLETVYNALFVGDINKNTKSLSERVRDIEEYIQDSKNYRNYMAFSMLALILNALWERLFP